MKTAARQLLSHFPSVMDFLRSARDWRDFQKPPALTVHGFQIKGPSLMREGCFEKEESDLIKLLSPHFDIFVNVGANIGYFVLFAASLGKKVIAVEASPTNWNRLLENLSLNKFTQIEVFPVAACEFAGTLSLYGRGVVASLIPGWSGASSSRATRIPGIPLDRIVETLPDKRIFVLMDVEGAELEVMKGAPDLLSSSPPPIWMVEINLTDHQPDLERARNRFVEVFRMFESAGYQAHAVGTEISTVDYARVKESGDLTPFQKFRNYLFTKDLPEAFPINDPAYRLKTFTPNDLV